ncbi:hypothetical protein HDV05_006391 [Chytridiales sp. JEL 0842]|nr:hypothetical protein HDV05_006391 [Chytridiales sp. JEL 0842]
MSSNVRDVYETYRDPSFFSSFHFQNTPLQDQFPHQEDEDMDVDEVVQKLLKDGWEDLEVLKGLIALAGKLHKGEMDTIDEMTYKVIFESSFPKLKGDSVELDGERKRGRWLPGMVWQHEGHK